ncbi:hypothetical protein C9374_012107 [Naegleria lovaniensis]|uniref:Uncharacterized protein n=1 Tax=Naegleria lovaniensis TaxID=51637 RepID=A0AA88G860_NAELO|nr:uncharacterized protein C9374_012107 [Naegleria lovaniensis]KAG2373500.1 hypothetical protein C9374_012107 [Naegleria lovaniensis]
MVKHLTPSALAIIMLAMLALMTIHCVSCSEDPTIKNHPSSDVNITPWTGKWMNGFVQLSPNYYSARILNGMSFDQVKFEFKVSSGSAVNVAIKKNSVPKNWQDVDYRWLDEQSQGSFLYSGIGPNDIFYVMINGASATWNLYALNFEFN